MNTKIRTVRLSDAYWQKLEDIRRQAQVPDRTDMLRRMIDEKCEKPEDSGGGHK